jgi:hypothetical protein
MRFLGAEGGAVTDGMRSLAETVPWRHLVGFENRLKSQDQIKWRIAEDTRVKGRTVDQAFTTLRDAIRYTFQYPEGRYKAGVADDLRALAEAGFKKIRVEDAWEWPEHKGMISCWRGTARVPFEVQFHTLPSYEAWQLTHPAYERLRDPATSDAERVELKAFIRKVYGFFGTAPGADDGETVAYYAIVDSLSSRKVPAGVLRRVRHRNGERDEAFGHDLKWQPTFLFYSAERGNLDNDMRRIGAEEAERIVERIRAEADGAV